MSDDLPSRRRFCLAVVSMAAGAARCGGSSITSPGPIEHAGPPGPQPLATAPAPPASPPPLESFVPQGPSGSLPMIPGTVTGRRLRLTVDGTALASGGGVAQSVGDVDGTSKFVLLTRSGPSEVTAVSATCTHQGCVVSRFEAPLFECSCHGSQFAWTGEVVRGPAPTALPRLATEFDGRVVEVLL
jgi:Rieske Fe-S protein